MQMIVSLVAILAGIIQGVTGFGSGIVLMMFLPTLFAVNTAAGVSTCICLLLNGYMCYTYRKYVNIKEVILPCILFLAVSSASIIFSKSIDAMLMKKIFGIFFILLSIYFLFLNKGDRKKLSLPFKLVCIVVSGMCDGLFGVGGPLMVIYYMSICYDTHEYLGTIQTFFFINCVYNTIFRIINGIVGIEHLAVIAFGIVGILLGGWIAKKIVNKLDSNLVRKLTYVVIGIAGILNVIK